MGQGCLRDRYTQLQYVIHYHGERNHQGIGNRLLQPLSTVCELHGAIKRRERLGGMLSYYHREAA